MFAVANAIKRAGRARILWIDDDQATLTVGRLILESVGYGVDTARSGRTGLELLASRTFDLVILDYDMPEQNGLDVALEIRRNWQTLPILVLSGGALPATAHLPANDVVLKGEPVPVLLGAVTRKLHGLPAHATDVM